MNYFPNLLPSGRQKKLYTPAWMRTWWQSGRLKYEPTEAQWPIHLAPHRFILVAGGERGGKSITAAEFVTPRTLDIDLVWIVATDYELCRPEFDYLKQEYRAMGMIEKISDPAGKYMPRSMELKVKKNGLPVTIQTYTAADEKKIAAKAPDIIVLAEAAQLSIEVWQRARGRVAQKRGIVLLEGTFEDSEAWYDSFWLEWRDGTPNGHISFSLPSWTNTVIYPGGMENSEIQALKEEFSEERFLARHGGIPTAPSDLVHPEFSYARHVGEYEFDPRLRVWLAIDPGYAGGYAVNALQVRSIGRDATIHVIDEVYVQRMQAREVISIVESRPWIRNVDNNFAGVMDVAGGQHHGNESQLEIWAESGYSFSTTPVSIPDGIERMRTFLKDPKTEKPRIYYNAETTHKSTGEFRKYKYPKARDGKPVRDRPIDANNHSIKAITYFLVKMFGIAERKRRRMRRAGYNINDGGQEKANGAFGAYPGRPRPVQQRTYAERWVAAHNRWKSVAENRNGTTRVAPNPRVRFGYKR